MGSAKRADREQLTGLQGRLFILRRENGLTQAEFARKIGMSQQTFASYENGRTEPSASALDNICKTYNVNRRWLEGGEGDMYITLSKNEEVARLFAEIMNSPQSSIVYRFAYALARLTPAELRAVDAFITMLAEGAEREGDRG